MNHCLLSEKRILVLLITLFLGLGNMFSQQTLTVYDGTAYDERVPVTGWHADKYGKCEYIFPEGALQNMAGSVIRSFRCYSLDDSKTFGGASYRVFMKTVDATTLSEYYGESGATVVYEGSLSVSNGILEVRFSTPYYYSGGNLLIGVYQTVQGSCCNTCHFYGETANGASLVGWHEVDINIIDGAHSEFPNFLPKTTFQFDVPGMLNGLFSVNENQVVRFSQGNLQYIGSASEPYWKFADDQWECLGTSTGQNSDSQNVDRDLFGWGTSGYNHGANCYQPWSTSIQNDDYYAYGSSLNDLYGETGQADWGYNAIYNGGNQENDGWRTLAQEEWEYLFDTRTTVSGIRFASAVVNNVNGMILLPDDWNADYYALNNTNQPGPFNSNTITAVQWNDLEQHGAVFLPVSGYRRGIMLIDVGFSGNYWTSTFANVNNAFGVYFNAVDVQMDYINGRNNGLSVRLVHDANSYVSEINVNPNPENGGSVNGGGVYYNGANCTLTAIANEGWTFVNWTENGETVSEEETFSFVVMTDRELTAHFSLNCEIDPENLLVQVDRQIYTEATVNWDSNADLFELRYGKDGQSVLSEGFEDGIPWDWATIDADGDGYSWSIGDQVNGNSFLGYNSNQCVSSASYINSIGALNPDNYLVLPQVELGGTLSFFVCAQDASYAAEHFGVAVSTTTNNDASAFTTIQEWTLTAKGAGMPTSDTRGDTRSQGTWYQYVVNLGNYAGQTGYIAIRHFNCTDMYFLNIDEVDYHQTEWTTITGITGTNYTLTGLDEMSDYIVQVRACCGDGESYSDWVGFSFTNKHYSVTVTADPLGGGTITGLGEYFMDEYCSLQATPNEGWKFVNWTENGEVLSGYSVYGFSVLNDHEFEAHFVKICTLDPENVLAQVNEADLSEATVSWSSNNDLFELRYGVVEERYYDDGIYQQAIGAGGSAFWWGVMFPAGSFTEDQILGVRTYDCSSMTGTVTVYTGGDTAPGTPIASADVTFTGANDFVVIPFNDPVPVNLDENVWVVFYNASGAPYPAAVCANTGEPNGRWVSLNGEIWADLPSYGLDYTFQVRALFSSSADEFVSVVDITNNYYSCTGLGEGNSYIVEVRSSCGDGETYSNWEGAFFTTSRYNVTVAVDPEGFGEVTGEGTYWQGDGCSVGVEPLIVGYRFVNWIMNGEVVSENTNYNFVVTEDANLVAHYEPYPEVEGQLEYLSYDWQTNSGARTWTHVWPDGDINFAYTVAKDKYYTDRGTGIGAYHAETGEWTVVGGRVENEKTGFGSIAQYGNDGLVIVAHTSEECKVYIAPDKDHIEPNSLNAVAVLDNTYQPGWPAVMTSGTNRDIIHIAATASKNNVPGAEGVTQAVLYFRSIDGGQTWDKENVILPYLGSDYGQYWNSNSFHWMETTADNRLALVVSNAWSDGMVLYSDDNGETWERKVFYQHPGPLEYQNTYYYPHAVSCLWDSTQKLHLLYEFNSCGGNPGSTLFALGEGGVAYWNEDMGVMDKDYVGNLRSTSWYLGGSAIMPVEYVGYLTPLTDEGDPECPYENTGFNITSRSSHGRYNIGVCGFPVLCAVPGSDDMVAVWAAMDENHTDSNGKYYYKIFARYSANAGQAWSPMVQLTKDETCVNFEHVFLQAAVVGRTLYVAAQVDRETGTFVKRSSNNDDNDFANNFYRGFSFNLDETFVTRPMEVFNVTVSANPEEGGTVQGAGEYYEGAFIALEANTNELYDFVNWTLNGEVVSTNPQYNTIVTGNNVFVANFEPVYNLNTSVSYYPDADDENSPSVIVNWNLETPLDVDHFVVYRALCNDATYTILGETTAYSYLDDTWVDLGLGDYKYGVSGVLTNGRAMPIAWGESSRKLPETINGNIVDNGNSAGLAPYQGGIPEGFEKLTWRNETSEANINYQGKYFGHFTLNDPAHVTLYNYSRDSWMNGACYMNDVYYFCSSTGEFGKFTPETGFVVISDQNPFSIIDYNPVDGKMYGMTMGVGDLYEINPEDGSYNYVANMGAIFALPFAITNEGRFIIGDRNGGEGLIREYHLETSELTTLFEVGFDINYGQDMAVDPETNELYWAAYNNSNNTYPLFKVDLDNYSLDTVGFFDAQVTGLAINPTIITVPSVAWTDCIRKHTPPSEITAIVNPVDGGYVEGLGSYETGSLVTLTARSNEGWSFVNWTEDGEVVSTDAVYSFILLSDRNLVANFTPQSHLIAIETNPLGGGTVTGLNTTTDGEYVDFESGELSDFGFDNSVSSYPWVVWSDNTYTGNYCMASSNNDSHSSMSYIDLTVNFLDRGFVKFHSRISSESNWDYGKFYIDGVEMLQETGTGNTWNYHRFEVTPGSHTFRWYYSKDGSVSSGEDRYYVDDVVFGTGNYSYGQTCSLTAIPSVGWSFENWTENGEVVSTDAAYAFVVTGDRKMVANFTPFEAPIPEGALAGIFSVSADQLVYFSQGNLQYIGSATTPYWKFADHQWDYFGATTGQNSTDQNVDRDLFGWGASGYNHGSACYQPWSTSQSASDYYAYGNDTYNLYDQTGEADWGFNAIHNGGNQENNGWRTLTLGEWKYLFNTRTTPSGIRYAKARVCDVNGVILLPDDWNSSTYPLNNTNTTNAAFTSNTVTDTQWVVLEQQGAVFLPAASYRRGTLVDLGNSFGQYWSTTYRDSSLAWYLDFSNSNLNADYTANRSEGHSVRLVRDALFISATPNPEVGGSVNGSGIYEEGDGCTLVASASAGYIFVNWTEDGEVLSTDVAYSFIVTGKRNLVANFRSADVSINNGVLLGSFSVSANQKVAFAQGNLQYIGAAEMPYWKFAEHQWDYLGYVQENDLQTTNRDLFGWGTSGYNHGANCYQPWSTSTVDSDYYAYGSSTNNLYDQTGQADWGYNAISNGGNVENSGWRTMNNEEWKYVFNTRNTPSGIRYAKATVYDIHGVILLPDDWDGSYFSLNNTNSSSADYSSNIITDSQWVVLEQHGAVFLPAAGSRHGTLVDVYESGSGAYWSSSCERYISNSAHCLDFGDSFLNANAGTDLSYAISVRLVRNIFFISATSDPEEGGTVSGSGTYEEGDDCTLTATASSGYTFVNWTENGEEVSTDTDYTFAVTENRDLVAHFVLTCTLDPENLQVQVNTDNYTEATVSWTSDNDLFELTYYNAILNTFEFGSLENWTTIDADGDGQGWYLVYSNTSDSGYGNSKGYVGSDSYINGVGPVTPDNYLVSPRVELGGTLAFFARAQDASWAAEHFGVAVSTTTNDDASAFTTIQEWTMTAKGVEGPASDSLGVNRAQGNWYLYSVDLSAYAGQMGYVAIRHFNCTDMYHLNVDDVYYIGPFHKITDITDTSYILTGLDDMSDYYVGVRSSCGDGETYSDLVGAILSTNHYTIALTSDPEEGGDVTGAGVYGKYTICTVQAEPADGYTFMYWTEDGVRVSSEATYSFAATNDRNLVAHFSLPLTISAVADPEQGGVVTGGGVYGYGSYCTLIATPNENYEFVNWTRDGDVISTSSAISISVTQDAEYVAHFILPSVKMVMAGYDPDPDNDQSNSVKVYWSMDTHFEPGWIYYDNGANWGAAGTNGGQFSWGIMFPAGTYTGNSLTKVSTYDYQAMTGKALVYQGGDTAPGTALDSVDVVFTGVREFVEFVFDSPVTIDPEQNLWVVFRNDSGATYPASYCTNTGDPNGRWVSTDGTWVDVTSFNLDDTWMIRAFVVNAGKEGQFDDMNRGEVLYYKVYRAGAGDTGSPELIADHVEETSFIDSNWSVLAEGWYRFGVSANYSAGESAIVWSAPIKRNAQSQFAEQLLNLLSGWNWWSSSLEMDATLDAALKDAIAAENTTAVIKNVGGNTMLENGMWSSVIALDNESMYMIRVDNAVTATLTGTPADPANHPITLASGWNWIGFPTVNAMTLDEAFAGITPNEEDVVKGTAGPATYTAEYGWNGSLTGLEPGVGYMYKNNGEPMTLVYPSTSKGMVRVLPMERYWMSDTHRHATTMTMLATLDASRYTMTEGNYEIGAFVGDECRGSARLQRVGSQYIAYLSVSGEEGETVRFKLYDVTNNVEQGLAEEQVTYASNAITGTTYEPVVLHFRGTTDVNEGAYSVSMYPNPTKDEVVIHGHEIETVKVYNALGQLVQMVQCGSADNVELHLNGLSAGVYLVNVRMANGQQANKRIVKE